jgi:DNA-binding NarL/FixJ family response regulator
MKRPIFLTQRPEPIPRWLEAFPDAAVMADRDADAATLAHVPIVWVHLTGDAQADTARMNAIRARAPKVAIVALSNVPEDEQGLAVLAAGASGYCSALTLPAVLRQVATVVEQGGLWVGPQLMRRMMSGLTAHASPAPASSLRMLSQRERQVADAVARGATNKEIARAMGITERTVKAHLTAAYEKLGVRDRVQLSLLVHGVEESTQLPRKISA